MGEGFAPPTVAEVFELARFDGMYACGCCFALVGSEGRQGHIDWHRRNGDAVFALFHADIGLKRKGAWEK